jgi:hypothetical protein
MHLSTPVGVNSAVWFRSFSALLGAWVLPYIKAEHTNVKSVHLVQVFFLFYKSTLDVIAVPCNSNSAPGTPYLKKDNYTVQETLHLFCTIDDKVEMPTSNPTTILTSILSGLCLGVDLRTNTKNICG